MRGDCPLARAKSIAVLIIGLVLSVVVVRAPAASAADLASAVRASVFLRVERVYDHHTYLSPAGGVFIHPDGFILTDLGAVSGTMRAPGSAGGKRVAARVDRVTAVVDSGMETERVLEAKIVALDRARGLALLKTDYRPESVVDVRSEASATVGEKLWIAGYPCEATIPVGPVLVEDDLLNPDVGIKAAHVESFLATDAGEKMSMKLAPGFEGGVCGGLIVDPSGHLVSVVVSANDGSTERPVGATPEAVRGFLLENSVRTTLTPMMILAPPQPIRVSVVPVLVDLNEAEGEVLLEGDDIDPIAFPLEPLGQGLTTSIEFPNRLSDRARPSRYDVSVVVTLPESRQEIRQVHVLDVVSESFQIAEDSPQPESRGHDDTERMGRPSATYIHISGPESSSGSQRDQLSAIAKSVTLRHESSDSAVIDNTVVGDGAGGKKTTGGLSRSRYERIENPETKMVVQEYDRLDAELKRLRQEYQDSLDGSAFEQLEYGHLITPEMLEVMQMKAKIAQMMFERGVRYCGNPELYYVADEVSNPPCDGVVLLN